jgi:Oxygenase, catalysing oxidative methylation of damaged DNA
MSVRSSFISSASAVSSPKARVAGYDWQALAGELDNYGCAVLPKLLSPEECRTIAALYPDESHFRSHIHMARHGFGKGEYRYFKYPLPDILDGLRTALYPRLARAANEWNGRMGTNERYPDRCCGLRSPSPASAGLEGKLPREPPPRRESRPLRHAPHSRCYLSRRDLGANHRRPEAILKQRWVKRPSAPARITGLTGQS